MINVIKKYNIIPLLASSLWLGSSIWVLYQESQQRSFSDHTLLLLFISNLMAGAMLAWSIPTLTKLKRSKKTNPKILWWHHVIASLAALGMTALSWWQYQDTGLYALGHILPLASLGYFIILAIFFDQSRTS